MVDSKRMGALIATLTIFGYFIPIVPEEFKFNIIIIGFSISILTYFEEYVKRRLLYPLFNEIVRLLCSREKYFRLLYVEKTCYIDEDGYGKITTMYKLLNESGLKRRYPIRIENNTSAFTKSLKEMERENKFEVQSTTTEYTLKWETISESSKLKEFYIIFSRDLELGDTREFMVRYEGEGLFRSKKSQLNAEENEKLSSIPIHVTDSIKIKIHFHSGYKYSDLRYCVRSPSKDELDWKCKRLQYQLDKGTGGTYVEIEEKDPWRNFEYAIEWKVI
ncbi:MAG TPA: hypothetical protein VIO58_04690 [Candidatus Methanoperedens sp.]